MGDTRRLDDSSTSYVGFRVSCVGRRKMLHPGEQQCTKILVKDNGKENGSYCIKKRVYMGVYWSYIGKMEKQTETTVL